MKFFDSGAFVAGCILLWLVISIYSQIKLFYICIVSKISLREYRKAYAKKETKIVKFSLGNLWSYQILTFILKIIGVLLLIIYVITRYINR